MKNYTVRAFEVSGQKPNGNFIISVVAPAGSLRLEAPEEVMLGLRNSLELELPAESALVEIDRPMIGETEAEVRVLGITAYRSNRETIDEESFHSEESPYEVYRRDSVGELVTP